MSPPQDMHVLTPESVNVTSHGTTEVKDLWIRDEIKDLEMGRFS